MNEFCRLSVFVPFAQVPYCVLNRLSNISDTSENETHSRSLAASCTILGASLTTFCVSSALSAISFCISNMSIIQRQRNTASVREKNSSSRLCGKEERIAQKA